MRNITVKMVTAYLLTILLLIFLNFLLQRLLPGDAIIAMYSGHEVVMTDELYAELVSRHGLDLPLHEQFLTYLSELAHGDLGYSYICHASTADLIMDALPWTLLLMGTAFLLSAVVGIVLGVESSWRRGRRFDRSLLAFMLLLDGFHSLVIGIIALAIFCWHFGWFPSSGAMTSYLSTGGIGHIRDVIWHLVLPLATLTLSMIPGDYLLIRNSMMLTIREPYVLTARAKGIRERRIKYLHAARNAILPFTTRIGVRLAHLITGMIFIETIFAYPGLGLLTYNAISNRDLPLMQGILTVSVILVLLINIVVDLLYQKIDLRVGYAY
ncbi:MAG: ABC transporter permease [Euryarchaeota archaeon]|nr:MAG: hypothetical protein C5S47_06040 [ANME-2 cluster archaeon]MEA1864169.1 ABC transporter permease [Euryarchaeota archaeon]